jgi:hypothetical protein
MRGSPGRKAGAWGDMSERTKRRNGAVMAGRLFSGSVENPEVERCHHCGELLHPYPEPEHWMQYPLPVCCVVDGLKFCDSFRKPGCVDAYLVEHPAPAGGAAEGGATARARQREKKNAKDATASSGEDRDKRAARLAVSMSSDPATLLDVAADAVGALHAAVLSGDADAAAEADDRYEAVIWKLNGGRFFGCMADEGSAGRVVERHCRAAPGTVPLWGQSGAFVVAVNGMRAIVEVSDRIGSRIGTNHVSFEFHAVDLDRPFISETGYRSHYDSLRAGRSVDQVAAAILAEFQKGKPKMIEPDYRDRRVAEPVPAWVSELVPPPRREPTIPVVPEGFALVDVVLPAHRAFIVRKWAKEAQAKIAAGRVAALKSNARDGEPKARAVRPERKQEGDEDQPEGEEDPAPPEPAMPSCSTVISDDGGPTPGEFRPGQRCEIISVHHAAFSSDIGCKIIITRVSPDTRQVWAHDDKPPRFRINRNGRRVTDYDPRCIQTIYSFEQLRVLT